MLRDHLERLGCHVEEAGDGTSAHLLLQARAHHLAFVDLDLPGLDGLALMGRVRRECGEPGVFLVATTASATSGIEETVRAAGAHAFLPKPIALPRLTALLEQCAARPDTTAALQTAPRPSTATVAVPPPTAASPASPPPPTPTRKAATAEPSPLASRPAAPTPPAVPAQQPSAFGLFAGLAFTLEMLRQLHAELDVEIQGLTERWRQADATAARRHAHRIASLGIVARDDALLQAARRAEEALQQNRGDRSIAASPAQPAIEELARAARHRLRQLAESLEEALKAASN